MARTIMKYLTVLIVLGIMIESILVAGQQLNNDDNDEYERPSPTVNAENGNNNANRRPAGTLNGKYKKVLNVQKDQQSVPVIGRRLNRPTDSEAADSVPASSIKKSFTVNNFDDNDDYFSRRRARFLFRQRVGK